MSDPIRIKADIIPYIPEYSALVRSWVDTDQTYRDVCRGQDFPPPEDLVDNWQRSGVSSYLLLSEQRPVAYCEIWKRPLEMACEIAHLIVDPTKRFHGYGTKML
ncbi:MAG: GNAT family N-acetyltransferase, partial [candidate division Zixibacteria bacterium]|nr:GNAT family N-acetyltransferase [candidate division Zixibacteria bacterium]